MKTAVWLLTQVLSSVLRIEHKVDLILSRTKADTVSGAYLPPMSTQAQDPVTGSPVQYTAVQLASYGTQVMIRRPTDQPQSNEVPGTIGD